MGVENNESGVGHVGIADLHGTKGDKAVSRHEMAQVGLHYNLQALFLISSFPLPFTILACVLIFSFSRVWDSKIFLQLGKLFGECLMPNWRTLLHNYLYLGKLFGDPSLVKSWEAFPYDNVTLVNFIFISIGDCFHIKVICTTCFNKMTHSLVSTHKCCLRLFFF